ncbi:hypothetical protein KQ873_02855 [Mycoplasma zalophidermidis]|uniref:hypothetical protein n=1 Tax=Mycoplasma zalophidermidis TaxID=398174 RepID=UPI001C11D9D0|nr:hypothetical protein [Mycoplasma zalophidermidis]MBU4689963.1 hypothetical protein [Mycoplasma zalophidermidis]
MKINSISKDLDQFYTNPLVCDNLVKIIKKTIPLQFKKNILEPSAGTGNFIDSLKSIGYKGNILAYDIEPKYKNIIKQDYLKLNIPYDKNRLIIGNPPFGRRGKLALDFLNKGLEESDYVCYILPNIFKRFSIQKRVKKNAKLILSLDLDEDSFIVNDREYAVKCVFQIWTTKKAFKNHRILQPPQIRHPDFKTYIHNNTKQTLKYFDKEKYGWDFAVHRQGYYDYSVKITNPKDLIKNRQYFFVRIINSDAKAIIDKIDFVKLSKTNTQVHGFSTSDFVKEYMLLKGEIC